MKIDDLNDDCLMYIIQYLPVADRVRIERVSTRWKSICQYSWRSFKNLRLKDIWGLKEPTRKTVNCHVLKNILRRCGKYLNSISFVYAEMSMDPHILEYVAEYCPNIQHLDASSVYDISSKSLSALLEKCSDLVSFTFFFLEDDDGESKLSMLFEKNKYLKNLCFKLGSSSRNTGKCLKKLNNQSVESIIIHYSERDFREYDNLNVLKDFYNLKQLIIENDYELNPSSDTRIYDVVAENMISSKNLIYLSLACCKMLLPTSLRLIPQLKNLKALILNSIHTLEDIVLASIEKHCKFLELLDISDNEYITNTGLASVFALPNIKFLNICYLAGINDEVFLAQKIPHSLRRIDCTCTRMENPGIAELIKNSENLEYINLDYCDFISSKKLLEVALIATRKRKSQVVLELYFNNTNAKLKGISPFLRINSEYRMSFMPEGYAKSLLG